jgi:hypothetical protein
MVEAVGEEDEEVMRGRVAEFAERGYVLLPDTTLSASELALLNAAIDADRAQNMDSWLKRSSRESGRTQCVDLLLTTDAFDSVCAHPAVLPTLHRLLGNDVRRPKRPCPL